MKNNANAKWTGTGQNGTGYISTKSEVLKKTPYTYKARAEGATGTTPEELIAAAHAGCFAMKLAFVFDAAGYKPESLEVDCEVEFVGGKVTSSSLSLKAKISEVTQEEFEELVDDAGQNCPISQLLNTSLHIKATLL